MHGIIIAGHYDKGADYMSKRPNGMSDWLIAYTLDGEGYFRTPAGEKRCGAGDIVLLRSGVPHQYGTVEGTRWHFVWSHFAQATAEISMLPEEEVCVRHIDDSPTQRRVYRAFKRILMDSRERHAYWQELCTFALREIFTIMLQKSSESSVDPRVEETLHHISQQLSEPFTVEQLARTVGVSPSRLSHLFKQQTGRSIIDTVNRMRIEQAALMLEHTNRTAYEVCGDVGFHNYNHFINQFRKHYSTSPSAYRKLKSQRLL
ncbi:helix-turn-helix domain-containing protein [Paenibacillus sp. NEAU-GSW1]|uniref:helix-turn-helix domain-containing protein n=1 Tax=Paenibacillus sp. NEAU-GSW1 TaxID=2682486 RepID=UPI0012E11EA1|nr:helix-turn-helix domain-containing protein [Paenibacillus sp. NEAU-GSW1]MUT64398.1 helix-turn-helix domain-containing protein [Paenibacillus sp. NEAU-GSW1]